MLELVNSNGEIGLHLSHDIDQLISIILYTLTVLNIALGEI